MKPLAIVAAMAALCATSQIAAAQTGTAPYCMQSLSGARCVYGTMGECESARSNPSMAQCITRTDAHGTTGLGQRPEPSVPNFPPQIPPVRSPNE